MLPLDSTTPAFGRAALLCYSTSVMAPGGIALIFDMDNTVLGSRIDFTAIRRELVSVLRAARATAEAPDALMGRAIAELVALGAAHDRAHRTQLVPELWRIIEAHEAAGLQDASALDGAPAVLRALRDRGYRIAILTNNGREPALAALRAAGLDGCAETIVARDDVAALKPAGDGVREALRRLGGVARAYVIGDSWIDGAAAAEAGAVFIAYRRSAEELRRRGIEPWRVIMHLGELLSLPLARGPTS